MLPSTLLLGGIVEGSTAPKQRCRRGQVKNSLYDRSTSDETIDDHDHCDHEQQMDQPPTDVHYEKPENPKDEENYRDRPKHDGILSRSELHPARQTISPAFARSHVLAVRLC